MDLSHIFSRFSGQVVSPDDVNDPVLKAMRQEAEVHGLKLRLQYPGGFDTCDYDEKRVNARIVKGGDGKQRIGKSFDIG